MVYRDIRQLDSAIELFEDCRENRGASTRIRGKIRRLLGEDEFLHAIFCPKADRDGDVRDISNRLTVLSVIAERPRCIRSILDAMYDYGHHQYGRSTAVFLVSLVNLGISEMNEKAQEVAKEHDHHDIDDDTYEKVVRRLDSYQDHLTDLLAIAKDIIKRDARNMSRECGLPKKLCQSALYTVPEPKYLDQYKIGYYLMSVLDNVYGYLDAVGDVDLEEVVWMRFFAGVFSKSRLPDVASLILMESPERVQNYENHHTLVMDAWDGLTKFALKTLNSSERDVRDHMIELYLKRLNRTLDTHGIRCRIDLRKIDDIRFDRLAETVKRYKSKFDDLMDRIDQFDRMENG